jgi:hypothetical protein
MRCRKVRSFLSAYYREETSAELSAKIKEHLSDCSSCRREAAAYRSMNELVKGLPQRQASSDFTSRLFQRIGQEGFARKKTRAYFPKRIPRFGAARLAAAASVAVIILSLGIGLNVGNRILFPTAPQMAGTTAMTDIDDDRYLTVQPTDNPLLNEHKSVSRMIEQYNRWREYSKSLRVSSGSDQFLGGQGVSFASSHVINSGVSNIMVRPVIRDYLLVPE